MSHSYSSTRSLDISSIRKSILSHAISTRSPSPLQPLSNVSSCIEGVLQTLKNMRKQEEERERERVSHAVDSLNSENSPPAPVPLFVVPSKLFSSPSSTAPSIVEAALKIENQQLREEIQGRQQQIIALTRKIQELELLVDQMKSSPPPLQEGNSLPLPFSPCDASTSPHLQLGASSSFSSSQFLVSPPHEISVQTPQRQPAVVDDIIEFNQSALMDEEQEGGHENNQDNQENTQNEECEEEEQEEEEEMCVSPLHLYEKEIPDEDNEDPSTSLVRAKNPNPQCFTVPLSSSFTSESSPPSIQSACHAFMEKRKRGNDSKEDTQHKEQKEATKAQTTTKKQQSMNHSLSSPPNEIAASSSSPASLPSRSSLTPINTSLLSKTVLNGLNSRCEVLLNGQWQDRKSVIVVLIKEFFLRYDFQHWGEWPNHIRILRDPLEKNLREERSQIPPDACELLISVVQSDPLSFYNTELGHYIPILSKGLYVTVKKVSSACGQCIDKIIQILLFNNKSLSVYMGWPKLFDILIQLMDALHNVVREKGAESLNKIIKRMIEARQQQQNNSTAGQNEGNDRDIDDGYMINDDSLHTVCNVIKDHIQDGDPITRQNIRDLYKSIAVLLPGVGSDLFRDFPATVQKLILGELEKEKKQIHSGRTSTNKEAKTNKGKKGK